MPRRRPPAEREAGGGASGLRARSSPVGRSLSIRPSRRRTIRRARRATSSSWVTMMIVLPAACSWSKTSRISSPVRVSRLPVGSSARRIDGIVDQGAGDGDALALPARELVGLVPHAVREPDLLDRLFGEPPALRRGDAGVDQRQLDVLENVGARDQVEGLEDESDLPVADVGQRIVVETRDVDAVDEVAAGGRHVEAADEVHHRRLARSRRSHDRHVLVVRDGEGDAAQGLDEDPFEIVGLDDVVQRERSRVAARGHEPFSPLPTLTLAPSLRSRLIAR